MTALPQGVWGRALAFGILIAVLLAFHMTVVAPLLRLYSGEQQTIEERVNLATRMAGAAAQLPKLREATRNGGAAAADDNFALTGASDAVAVATLQTVFKTLVERQGAKLGSVEILPPESADSFSRIAIRASFTCDLSRLTSVLQEIETSRPALFVDKLDVRVAEGVGDTARAPALIVVLDVYGLRLPS